MDLLLLFGTALLLGLAHAFEADHMAAVSAFAVSLLPSYLSCSEELASHLPRNGLPTTVAASINTGSEVSGSAIQFSPAITSAASLSQQETA